MTERLSRGRMETIAARLKERPVMEGYPEHRQRLTLARGAIRYSYDLGRLIVPDGEWHVHDHVNRRGVDPDLLDVEVPNALGESIPESRVRQWQQQGLELDQENRPVHPYWRQLLADPRIGLPTGIGFFYRYGMNGTADTVVTREFSGQSEVLLIQRPSGEWALPGGFIDLTDASPAAAAAREVEEETGLKVSVSADPLVKKEPVGGHVTLHAWAENYVYVADAVDQDYLYDTELKPSDEVIDAGWFSPEKLAWLKIFANHGEYIGAAGFSGITDENMVKYE